MIFYLLNVHSDHIDRNVALQSLMKSYNKIDQSAGNSDTRKCEKNKLFFSEILNLSKNDESFSEQRILESVNLFTTLPTQKQNKFLIEEVSTDSSISTPKYEQSIIELNDTKSISIKIWIPGITNVKECVLDVSEVVNYF